MPLTRQEFNTMARFIYEQNHQLDLGNTQFVDDGVTWGLFINPLSVSLRMSLSYTCGNTVYIGMIHPSGHLRTAERMGDTFILYDD